MSDRLDSLAIALLDAREENAVAQKKAKTTAKAEDEAELALWTALESELGAKITTVTVELPDPYGKVQLQRRLTVTARILDADVLKESLAAEGLDEGYFGDPSPRKKPLNDLAKTRRESGQPLPDGMDRHEKKYVTVTRRNK